MKTTKTTTIILLPSDMRSPFPTQEIADGITVQSDVIAVFGPYIDLPSGRWEICLNGKIECASENCLFEITAECGEILIAASPVVSSNGRVVISEIDIRMPVSSFEIRIFLTANSVIKIDSIELNGIETPCYPKIFDIYGLRLILDNTSLVDQHLIQYKKWEESQISYLRLQLYGCRNKSEKKYFLDIGAYFGLYSMLMAKVPCFEEIHAFEVDEFNYRQMVGNLFLNDISLSIKPHYFGASDIDGEARFVPSIEHPTHNRGGMSILESFQSSVKEVTVQTRTLDGFLPIANSIIFAKIDVEGHEMRVIAGMNRLLMSNQCMVQVECLSELRFNEMNSVMTQLGYKVINRIVDDYYFSNFI